MTEGEETMIASLLSAIPGPGPWPGVPAGPADVPLVMQAILFFFWSLTMAALGALAMHLRKCPQCPPPAHGGGPGWSPPEDPEPEPPDPGGLKRPAPWEPYTQWDIDQALRRILKQEELSDAGR